MAHTYPLTVSFNECLGSRANSLSFTNLRLVDLQNGQSQYLSTVKQLVDALPKTEDTSSRFALQGHIAHPGQKRLRHSMRAPIRWLLPSDGIFRHSSDSLNYFLTRQGRCVVLRRGDVTLPLFERHLNWVNDPAPPPSRYHGDLTSPAPSGDHSINQENTLPQDTIRKIPRKLRPRIQKEKQPGSATKQNSPSQKAGSKTQCEPLANRNSASQKAGSATRPGSRANHDSAFQEADSVTRLRSTANENSPLTVNQLGNIGSNRSTQWSIPGPSCTHSIHSIPDSGPIRMQKADLTRTTLNSGVYINRSSQASSRITPNDLVKTPSPDLASPHLFFSDLIETPSLDCPLGFKRKEIID